MTEEDCLAYKKHILNTYFECDMQNKVEARREMLRILSKSKGFNTHFFKCSVFL